MFRPPVLLLYFQAMILGIQYTAIPSAGNFLTSHFGFTGAEYSSLFIPMIIMAVLSSFFGGILAQHYSNKLLFLVGVVLNGVGLALVALMALSPYIMLLVAMSFLGAGFGATMTALNPLVVHYFCEKSDIALTAMQACLGIGMALSPLLLNAAISLQIWWVDPLTLACINLVILLCGLALIPKSTTKGGTHALFIPALVIFALLAFLYGIIETTFGNWTTIYLYQERGFSLINANNALAIFWGSLTVGRIAATLLMIKVSSQLIYRLLPLVILVALGVMHFSNREFLAFALAGLGCSALFPLTISFAQRRLPQIASFSSGVLIASNLMGYGTATSAGGLLHSVAAMSYQTIYLWLGLIVIVFGICAYIKER